MQLDDEPTPLHRVDEDVSRLEQRIAAPRAHELNLPTARYVIIFRVNVNKADFLDTRTRRISGNRSHIQYAESGAVVGLVREAVGNVLVVVDTLCARLVQTGLLGLLERRDVPDVGDGVAVGAGPRLVVLSYSSSRRR